MTGIPSSATYIYMPGSGLEVPGLEAVLEYGDASKMAGDRIPGAVRINDRSMPDQIHVTDISGLHDDPDGRDSRINNADRHGERSGLMLYGGRTIGITGRVQSGNVNRMRDLWRQMRSQFGTVERDLLVHPPDEVPTRVNAVSNTFGADGADWEQIGAARTITAVQEGALSVGNAAFTTSGSGTMGLLLPNIAEWDGVKDIYLAVYLKAHSGTFSSFTLDYNSVGINGGSSILTLVTQSSPTTGTWYLLATRLLASQVIGFTRTIGIEIEANVVGSGSYVLRIARPTMVLLDPSEATPPGPFDGTIGGFAWDGAIAKSTSRGTIIADNQISDPSLQNITPGGADLAATWQAANSTLVTVNTAPSVRINWRGDSSPASLYYKATKDGTTTARDIGVLESNPAEPALGSHLIGGGRTYRLSMAVNAIHVPATGIFHAGIEWLSIAGTVISTSFSVAIPAGVSNAVVSAAAPTLAVSARVRVICTGTTTASAVLEFYLSDLCLVDVTDYDPGSFFGSGYPHEEILGTGKTGVGARRRIPRPFLLKGVRKTSDMKAPEQQTNLQARRAFTMSLRASDPRIYVVDERRASLKLSGTPQFVAKQSEVFTLNSHPAPVPTGFTYEGQSIPSLMEWATGPFYPPGTKYPQSAISPKLWDASTGIAITDPASDVVARVYRSAESYVYQQPRVVLGCSPASRLATSAPLGRYYSSDNTTPYNNSARILLKRVNSTTWLELRWYTGSHASSLAGWIPAPADAASPYTFELWCSHNTSGTLGATRLAQADYTHWPLAYLQASPSNVPFDPQTQPQWLVAYMLSNVVYWELWESYPSSDLSTRVETGSYGLTPALQTLIGASVSGNTGYSLVVPKTDDPTNNWPNMALAPPFVHYFETSKADIAPSSLSVPVIGDVDTPEVITLRGDMVNPTVSMSTPNEDGTTSSSFARFIGTMADTNPVSIDMATGAITDSQGNNAYSQLQPGGSFSTLRPGANLIVVSAENWSTTPAEHASVAWRDALT